MPPIIDRNGCRIVWNTRVGKPLIVKMKYKFRRLYTDRTARARCDGVAVLLARQLASMDEGIGSAAAGEPTGVAPNRGAMSSARGP
jgi:hypothetical protein